MTTIEVDENEYGAWTVLRVRGEMDLVTSPRIRKSVHAAVAGGRHDLVIDLSGVRFCDSSGVGVLIATRRLLRSCGGRLRLILPDEQDGHVARVLAALGVQRLFEVYEDVPDALPEPAGPAGAAGTTGPAGAGGSSGASGADFPGQRVSDRIAP
ncbi:STAS domain-containing protein [Streptomyces sp. NPDC057695]|uniref:STAS domain-containing protein n=1 Tax=Streptomyces sp. NPDC057695 TaxID=3346217 RepID=UPI0036867E1D